MSFGHQVELAHSRAPVPTHEMRVGLNMLQACRGGSEIPILEVESGAYVPVSPVALGLLDAASRPGTRTSCAKRSLEFHDAYTCESIETYVCRRAKLSSCTAGLLCFFLATLAKTATSESRFGRWQHNSIGPMKLHATGLHASSASRVISRQDRTHGPKDVCDRAAVFTKTRRRFTRECFSSLWNKKGFSSRLGCTSEASLCRSAP